MQAVCLFLRARAVVKFFLRTASSLENTDGEQRALWKNTDGEQRALWKNTDGEQRALRVLRKFFASRNLSFINRIHCFAPSNS